MLFMNLSQTLHAIPIICNFISLKHFFKVYPTKAKLVGSRALSLVFNSGLVGWVGRVLEESRKENQTQEITKFIP